MQSKKRILTGDRPTGQLHLGHYVGTLKNRVRLQDEYDCFFIIADLQVLTDHLKNHTSIEDNVFEVMCDYLGVGLKPENVFFVQSQVPELAELTMYFSFLVTLARLQRNPTVKDEAKTYGVTKISYGFLGYPISQAADILAFKADLIPVGQDQLPHIEQTREIVRSFNQVFDREVFALPEPLVGEVPILVGTDGANKMSKGLDNYVSFANSSEETERRILNMVTDRKRPYRKDPGHPDECFAFKYWSIFAPSDTLLVRQECEAAARGCRECKAQLAGKLNEHLAEIRERRQHYTSQPDLVWDILASGTKQARVVATETLEEVREAMRISFPRLRVSTKGG
ncbi:MAG TPA: tryptophan--tRNA ligase [Candidatus Yonathbacteria bacterium]|nr:tryptophan--tRNA ligase [Candidatus Yonathbacteria bacterium]